MASQIAKEVMRLASNRQYKEALNLLSRIKVKNLTVTRATLKSKYCLKPKDIEKLHYIEVDNPHVKSAGKMRLYLRAEAYNHSLKIKRSKKIKSKSL
ncbi:MULTISPECIES: hypothetical protein [Flavobacteriaceae]|uniref:XPA C-terminal domain-containing protein n=2 Tax=Flavobacteriaceae TaxID=49546 RepID=A0A4Y8ARQ6_9FLAO|nr:MULTISPECIES: hypothetical protein [Flavobacteriaceae]TEW73880.1 hypothetical protein E2488_10400 [Gramella jeungdoensis]GGK38359.1 hypothetical protein GCM10007963_03130 [Lutibacter litoralis]